MQRALSSTSNAARSRSGFTLIEIIVAVAILGILAGAAVPIAAKAMTSAARRATREELALLASATQEYFRDTETAPTSLADLERDPGEKLAPGWSGPYLPGAMTDPIAGGSGYLTDAWSREYSISRKTGFTITSMGQGGEAGGDDDLSITVDFTPIRREKTLDELRVLNQAITLYNAAYMSKDPLSANWKKALPVLVEKGYLPSETGYDADAFGSVYVADPAGKSPLVKLASSNVSAKVESSSKSESGSDKK